LVWGGHKKSGTVVEAIKQPPGIFSSLADERGAKCTRGPPTASTNSGVYSPPDSAGVRAVDFVFVSADEEIVMYSQERRLTDLYVVKGLR
jgi:hypothetical protein